MSTITFPMCCEDHTLQRRRLMGERFVVVQMLGHGSFGEVVLVEDRYVSGSLFVMKRAKMPSTSQGMDDRASALEAQRVTISEARIMSLFNDDGIVRLIDAWHEELDDSVCLLMEYCAGGDLEHFAHESSYPLAEDTLRLIFLQCLLALAQMHAKSVVHRDMKLSNILVSGCRSDSAAPVLKIADFGLSTVWCEATSHDAPPLCVGTPLYMSPETAAEGLCSFSSDVWSLGVVFYRLMTRCVPFVGNSFEVLRNHIATASPPHPSRLPHAQYSLPLGDLVLSMLAKQPRARPTARELIASPLFARTLRQAAWRPRALRSAVCFFACQPGRRLRILAEPRHDAAVVAELCVGDHALVAGHVLQRRAPADCAAGTAWLRVVAPRGGFCAAMGAGGQAALQYVADPRAPGTAPPPPERERERERGPLRPLRPVGLLIRPPLGPPLGPLLGPVRPLGVVRRVGASPEPTPHVPVTARPGEGSETQAAPQSPAKKLIRVILG